jgi:hypothetical protein
LLLHSLIRPLHPLSLPLSPKRPLNKLLKLRLQWLLLIPPPHKVLPRQSWKPILKVQQKLLLRWLKWLRKLLL